MHLSLMSIYTDGTVTVSIGKLRSGEKYLRYTNPEWVAIIKKSMQDYNFYVGAPLVAIVDCKHADFDCKLVSLLSYLIFMFRYEIEAS